jgi:hypothetical protein
MVLRERVRAINPELVRPGWALLLETDMTLKVLDPRLEPEGEALCLAAPLASLEGATIALLDNAKIGTARFYDFLGDMLRDRYGVRELIRGRKPDASRPVPPELLAEMSGADALVSAIGD